MSTLKQRMEAAMEWRVQLAQERGEPKPSKTALARACKVSQPSVTDWFNGETKALEGSNLIAAAAYLEVRPAWLGAGQLPMCDLSTVPGNTKMEAHSTSHPQPTLRGEEVVTLKWEERHVWREFPKRVRMQAPDDALSPEVRAGQWVLFTTELTAGPEDFVLVRDREGELYMREYCARSGGRFEATPLNQAYPSFWSDEAGLVVVAVYTGVEPSRRGRG